MKFSLAEMWGMITILTIAFAAIHHLFGNVEAIIGLIVLFCPVHAIVVELVDKMGGRAK